MIEKFIFSSVRFILESLIEPLLDFFGFDTTQVVYYAEQSFDLIVQGWKFMNIFVPTLDVCLGMAIFCISIEMAYKAYLLVLWIIKKIPVLGVS